MGFEQSSPDGCTASRSWASSWKRLALVMLAGVLAGTPSLLAQAGYNTATLKGTIYDQKGAAVASATVTVKNLATDLSKEQVAATDGSYQIPALPPGTYQMTVQSPGFRKAVAENLVLTVGATVVYDVHLRVGGVHEVVEVTDRPSLIQTEQTQQADTISLLQITDLPNINHEFTQQVYTLPGVSNSDAPRTQQPGYTGYVTTGFSIGGSNGRNNLSTIDGGENEYGTGQYRIPTIPQEAIQEYQVNRNGFAAEFGFTDGSAINIVTKSGGNQYHGVGYGYFQDRDTSAQNYFNGMTTNDASTYNQGYYTGFTLGGPIKKDKLFFFMAYDYQNKVAPDYTNAGLLAAPTLTGPTQPQTTALTGIALTGDPLLQGFAGAVTQVFTPLSGALPASVTLKKIMTAENGVFFNKYHYQNALVRLDAQPNSSNSISLRAEYEHNDVFNTNPDFSTGPLPRDFSILGTWNHVFSPSLVNQLLIQLVPKDRSSLPDNSPFQGVQFSFPGLTLGSALANLAFFGSSSTPYYAHQQRYQFEDNLTWAHGAHTFSAGASMRMAHYTVTTQLWFNPEFDFASALPVSLVLGGIEAGFAAAVGVPVSVLQADLAAKDPTDTAALTGAILSAPQSFVFGLPVDFLAGFNNPTWTGWSEQFGSYIQDRWKVNSRLTVNAGVRFDYDAPPAPMPNNNFTASPRLGFAWDVFGDHKTVVRGGGGVFVAPINLLVPSYLALLNENGHGINEFISVLSPTNPIPVALWQTGVAEGELPFGRLSAADYAAFGINPAVPGKTVYYTSVNPYRDPYTVQANLSLQRQLGPSYSFELGYLMYHGVHLGEPIENGFTQINPGNPLCPPAVIPPSPSPCTDATGGPLYVYTHPGTIEQPLYTTKGHSSYNALTASLTKRYSRNLQFQVNYTWSKTLDNVIDFSSYDDWYRPSMLNRYYTISVYNIPQLFVANAVYTTPFKAGTGNVLRSILGDITLAPIVTVRNGLPYSVLTSSLGNVVTDGVPGIGNSTDQDFATPFRATRDDNRGPYYATADLSFMKSIYLNRDRGVKLNLVAMGTNIFNRTNFDRVSDTFDLNGIPAKGIVQTADGPLNLVTGPFTGLHGVKPTALSQATQPLYFSTADLPRQIQFGVKLQF